MELYSRLGLVTLLCLSCCAVTNSQNSQPKFNNLPNTTSPIPENTPVGTFVFTCTATDPDPPDSDNGTFSYSFNSGNRQHRFSMDAQTGMIFISQPLDFETAKEYVIYPKVTDLGGLSSTSTLTVSIGDVNDNSPTCTPNTLLLIVNENTAGKVKVGQFNCSDPDPAPKGQLTYQVIPGKNDTTIYVTPSGEVQVLRNIDYETEAHIFEILVNVKDHGTSPLVTTATVIFSVKDVDDNKPVFSSNSYTDSIQENATIGTTVLKVITSDIDQLNTPASTVTYGFENNKCTPDVLLIDPHTGDIIVKTDLDFEANTMVLCTVTAYSSNQNNNKNTASVTISIQNVNDGFPFFNQLFYHANVTENTNFPSTLLTVTATDPEKTLITYSIEPTTMFDIDNNGMVKLLISPDYETNTSVLATITASNAGSPPLNTTVLLQVSILPVNEHPPVFSGNTIVSITENAPLGASVINVTATDLDAGSDGVLNYNIVEANTPFVIDSSSGLVRLAKSLDYEKQHSYNFTVQVSDNSTQPKTASKIYTVNVLDVDDENSVVCSSNTTAVVRQPYTLNTPIATVSCQNLDTQPKGLNFTIAGGNTPQIFQINPSTGSLSFISSPSDSRYDLSINVTDGVDRVNLIYTVLVELLLKITNLPNATSIKEGITQANLYQVTACCAFSNVNFYILSGNEDGRISLSRSTGAINLMVPYDRENKNSYVYQIQAVSGGSQNTSANFTVNVLDENDNPPTINPNFLKFPVHESLKVGTIIVNLKTITSDLDEGLNANITYSFVSGNQGGTFDLNSNADFVLAKSLDYETQNNYTLIIQGKDSGSPPLSGTAVFLISVQDDDEYSPFLVPVPGAFSASLSEDVALGTPVFQLQANYSDPKATVTYAIIAGNSDGDFDIVRQSGFIYTNKYLDRERTPFYYFLLQAKDQNGKATNGTLNVTITDVNDNDATFSYDVYHFYVLNNLNSNMQVGSVKATDPDAGNNGTVTVTLTKNPLGHFKMSGFDLLTDAVMDYQKVRRYRLEMTATDQGNPPRSGVAVVVVDVLPDKNPKFANRSDSVSVREDQVKGYQIYDASATALGALEDGNMVYSIVSGDPNNDFLIRPDSGEVIINKALEYKVKSIYTLTIRGEVTFANDNMQLTVNIMSVNRNSPVFAQATYTFDVSKDAVVGHSVGTVLATDKDAGSFGDVTMTMSGSSPDFSMSTKGEIIVAAKLNYSRSANQYFLVEANDGGSPSKNARASVVIHINYINENTPAFATNNPTTTVLDSVPKGSEVFQFYAMDQDPGSAGNVSYFFINHTTGEFSLSKTSGILTTEIQLDASVTATYKLTVMAEDAGTPSLSSSTTLTVNVIASDPNYYPPQFSLSNPATVTVPRYAPVGYNVLNASATDKDYGISGQVVHKISSGNTDGFFLMEYATGQILTATSLVTAQNSYSLDVFVQDKGRPSRNASLNVIVHIVPMFSTSIQSDYNFSVAENATVGTVVGVISVDAGRNVTGYSIHRGNYGGVFTVTPDANNRGEVKVAQQLDYETCTTYNLMVNVSTDFDSFSKAAQVNIEDVNDNFPKFPSSYIIFNVPEHSPVGFPVGVVSYTDADISPANRLNTLSVGQGSPCIIDQSGLLTMQSVLDFEKTPTSIFTVYVTDNKSANIATATVTLSVIDITEEEIKSPSTVTNSSVISLEVHFQAMIGELIYTLIPGDFGLSVSASAVLEYIAWQGTNPISIHPATGDITVIGTLHNHTSYFQWTMIRIYDGGNTTTRAVLIRLDTFDLYTEMAVVIFAASAADVQTNRQLFYTRAQAFLSPSQRFGITKLADANGGSRRRLLATETAGYSYIVADRSVDDMSNVNQPKNFLSSKQILNAFQQSADGTPVSGLSDPSTLEVSRVEPYQRKESSSSASFDEFSSSPGGIAFWVLLALLLLIALIILIVCWWNRYYRRLKDDEKPIKKKKTKKDFSRVQEKQSPTRTSENIYSSAPSAQRPTPNVSQPSGSSRQTQTNSVYTISNGRTISNSKPKSNPKPKAAPQPGPSHRADPSPPRQSEPHFNRQSDPSPARNSKKTKPPPSQQGPKSGPKRGTSNVPVKSSDVSKVKSTSKTAGQTLPTDNGIEIVGEKLNRQHLDADGDNNDDGYYILD